MLPHQSSRSAVVHCSHPVNYSNPVVVGRNMLRIIRCSLLPVDSAVWSRALNAFFSFSLLAQVN